MSKTAYGRGTGERPFDGGVQWWIILLASLMTLSGVSAQRVQDIDLYGSRMGAEEAIALEASLKESPDNEVTHIQLYSYYSRKRKPETVEARVKHALWLIEHAPQSAVHRTLFIAFNREKQEEAFERARGLWLGHIDQYSEDVAVLEYGGLFLRDSDPDTAKDLFLRGMAAEPEEPRWPGNLGNLSIRAMRKTSDSAGKKKQLAAEAFGFLEQAYQLSSESGRALILSDLCQTALQSGQYEKAKHYARQMLFQKGAGAFGYQKNHYHGHTVLGVLKFDSGDLEEARRLLMRSIELPESARAMRYKPDLSLVRRFIEHDDTETAVAFFKACESAWKDGRSQLQSWQETLQAGEGISFEHPRMY